MTADQTVMQRAGLSFFVLGAQKAGTTALHHYLAQHPRIFLPAIKETHFFNDGHEEYRYGVDHYLERYFAGVGDDQIAGEVDPEYLYFPECAGRIADAFPDARLIFIFRDPVSRANSHYWMNVRRGWESLSLGEALEREEARLEEARPKWPRSKELSRYSYVSRGFYYRQVKNYLARFPRENMLFLLSHDLGEDAAGTMAKVYDFLGVDYLEPQRLSNSQRNRSAQPRSRMLRDLVNRPSPLKSAARLLLPRDARAAIWSLVDRWNKKGMKVPPMEPAVEQELRERFRSDLISLSELLQVDLSQWMEQSPRHDGPPAMR